VDGAKEMDPRRYSYLSSVNYLIESIGALDNFKRIYKFNKTDNPNGGDDVYGNDPSHRDRVDELPVGLKNLAATCYLNSYLQVI
jgi:ubiquitin C-terminal hydrolase